MDFEALERLGRLRDTGILSEEEFAVQKQRLLESRGAVDPMSIDRGDERTPVGHRKLLLIGLLAAPLLALGLWGLTSRTVQDNVSDEGAQVDPTATSPETTNGKETTAQSGLAERTEAALIDQLSCRRPPQAGLAITTMLRNGLLRKPSEGGDGILLFVPVKPMTLMGFPIARIGGWQPDPNGDAMPPFGRGPGTAPPNHIAVVVKASPEQVERELARRQIREAAWVPDPNQAPSVSSDGTATRPQLSIPGAAVEKGDYDGVGLTSPLRGVTTIECSASEYDFEQAGQFLKTN